MSNSAALERFLRTDPRDVGCAQAMDVLHIYVELVLTNTANIADVARHHYPGVVAHLLACGPCAEDYWGLLAAAGSLRPIL